MSVCMMRHQQDFFIACFFKSKSDSLHCLQPNHKTHVCFAHEKAPLVNPSSFIILQEFLALSNFTVSGVLDDLL